VSVRPALGKGSRAGSRQPHNRPRRRVAEQTTRPDLINPAKGRGSWPPKSDPRHKSLRPWRERPATRRGFHRVLLFRERLGCCFRCSFGGGARRRIQVPLSCRQSEFQGPLQAGAEGRERVILRVRERRTSTQSSITVIDGAIAHQAPGEGREFGPARSGDGSREPGWNWQQLRSGHCGRCT